MPSLDGPDVQEVVGREKTGPGEASDSVSEVISASTSTRPGSWRVRWWRLPLSGGAVSQSGRHGPGSLTSGTGPEANLWANPSRSRYKPQDMHPHQSAG